eukprot:scaffold118_cov185-Amphora_coffeaeformis.AAC.16
MDTEVIKLIYDSMTALEFPVSKPLFIALLPTEWSPTRRMLTASFPCKTKIRDGGTAPSAKREVRDPECQPSIGRWDV